MNEQYFEVLVKQKSPAWMKSAQTASLIAGVALVIFGFLFFLPALLFGIALIVASYVLKSRSNVEYEYLYVDKELQIDRITSESKRKRVETLALTELEALAPVRSHQLDGYRNNNWPAKDYSSGSTEPNANPYMLVMNGKKVIFEPTEEMVKTIQMIAPRKVFTY